MRIGFLAATVAVVLAAAPAFAEDAVRAGSAIPTDTTARNHAMQQALFADAASPDIPAEDRIYDWLIGSWRARVVDHYDHGARRESRGEWHFAHVLEGRAIQDVWISPPRAERRADTPKFGNRYGTSLRAYHPIEKRWHVTWINPVSGALNLLVARREGKDIVQEGRDGDGNRIRWVFAEIERDSARWYGERSVDDGETWQLQAEFFLQRE